MKVGNKQGSRIRTWMPRGVTVLALLGGLLCATWRSDAADNAAPGDAAASSGLRGVLPNEVPDDLTDSIGALPESWKPWGDALLGVLTELYTKADLDVAGQRSAIAALRVDLNTLKTALADPTYRRVGSLLAGLHGQLKRRVDVAEAALDTAVANGPEVGKNLTALLAALDQYEATQTKAGAADARKAYDAVRSSAADGGERMTQALSANYLNHNLRVDASQAFLTKLIGQNRTENGPVDDCILGAKVDGCQTTVSNVSVQLIPSATCARLNLVIHGQVNSSTQGVKQQATVYTQGYHQFTASKEVDFDGDQFWTGPAGVSVSPYNNFTGAKTMVSWIPLLGGIAEGIALNAAENQRGESEAIAASRITDRVVPQLNDEVDRDFGPTGKRTASLQQRLATFRELGVYPETKSYKTSDRDLFLNARLMAADELGGAAPEPIQGTGLSLHVHESLMNNSSDRMALQGRTITQDELRNLFEQRFSKLFNQSLTIKTVEQDPEADKGPNTMIFDKVDPIRFHAADGALNITVKAAFKQEGKEDIPPQIVTLPIKFSVQGNSIVAERGEVRVSPVDKPDNVAKQIARAGVIKTKFESALPRREHDRTVKFQREDKSTVNAVITRIDAVDGWLILLME